MAARARDDSSDSSGQPQSDAYTGMLIISLIAQITGVVFLYLDWSQYPTAKPSDPPAVTSGSFSGGGTGAQK